MNDPSANERDLEWIKKSLEEIKLTLASREARDAQTYVTKAEFEPVKRLVYGLAGLVLASVVMALVAQVVVSR